VKEASLKSSILHDSNSRPSRKGKTSGLRAKEGGKGKTERISGAVKLFYVMDYSFS
jgi:hypothetical protein